MRLYSSNQFISRRPNVLMNRDIMSPLTRFQYFQEQEKKLNKKRKKLEDIKKENPQVQLQPPLITAQIISLFPIDGITGDDPSQLKFRWRSFKMFYCLTVLSFELILCFMALAENIEAGLHYQSFGEILFYGGTACASFSFLRLARDWKHFMGEWTRVQRGMGEGQHFPLRRQIRLITAAMVISSVVEHALAILDDLINKRVSKKKDHTTSGFLKTRSSLFIVFSNTTGSGVLSLIFNLIVTMIWNYTDIFLITVSLALGKMFKEFTADLEATSKFISQELSVSYWKRRRETYSQLSRLMKLADRNLSVLVLLSFCVNCYYISLQLLHTIKPLKSQYHLIYFGTSFGYLLCRTCAVSFAASSIYENSKRPLSAITSVPSENFNIEVQRLHQQVSTETLALTGCKLFTVTRTLMLTIAGTIVTYEIVLVQFKAVTGDENSNTNFTASYKS